ncbi:hypothetical protein PC116_g23506 [Phytophthora cactorum]|uniref:Uncharacterized protein n=1 Tax=Phytophthora cactorum TaxID=29920 RepID=A0A8T1BL51_9STRA|nr:hypothetical protein Pcac1_g26641 [Phytophthora cactorum]KAG2881982.1 hypothetical protein PC114_g21267 [Phytophthora cactorum]KAG2904298.1 hypothetical protein PC117_g21074 [Phytophthora cactorum]KAG2982564.1 hypothetical protein PC119_g20801 [Phytophthora cactorum]KAG3001374.1 hypothetical protein PC120_g20303 [Phytophthora cactorum]
MLLPIVRGPGVSFKLRQSPTSGSSSDTFADDSIKDACLPLGGFLLRPTGQTASSQIRLDARAGVPKP